MSLSAVCASLRDAIQADPLTPKILVVPAISQGTQMLERICLEGGAWVNVRVATMRSIALDIAALEVAKLGKSFADDSTVRALVEQVLAERVKDGAGYFSGMRLTAGLVDAVLQALRELRLADLDEPKLPAEAFGTRAKRAEFTAILKGYREELAGLNACDEADVYRLALRAAAGGACLPGVERFLVVPGLRFHTLSRRLFQALVEPKATVLASDPVHGLEPPRTLIQSPPGQSVTSLGYLFAPEDVPAKLSEKVEITLFHASSPTNELREALRQVFAEGLRLDDVEIVATDTETYGSALHGLSLKLGLACTLADGLSVLRTRPGRAAEALLSWIEGGFFVEPIRRSIAAGDILLPEHDGQRPSSVEAARLLRSAGIGWNRNRYLPAMAAAIRKQERELEEPGSGEEDDEKDRPRIEHRLSVLGSLRRLFQELLDAIPSPDPDGEVRLASLVRAVRGYLADRAHIASEADGIAQAVTVEALDRSLPLSERSVTMAEAIEALRTLIAGVRVLASNTEPGAIHVSSYRRGGHTGRRRTFVVGLDESRFPGKGLQDSILLDRERRALSEDLPTSADGLRENLFEMASLLGRLRGKVTLSYAGYDPLENREIAPCSVMLQGYRLSSGKSTADYSELLKTLGELRGAVPSGDALLDETDLWFQALGRGPVLADGQDAVRAEYQGLAAGLAAEAARESDQVTTYDGKIEPRDELDPRQNPEVVMSCGAIEQLATCPHAYFLERVLRVRKPEEVEYDPTRWLDPLARGSLLHEVFCRYMRTLRGRGLRCGDDTLRLALKVLKEVAAEFEDEIPAPSEQVRQFEMQELEDSVRVFHQLESVNRTSVPRYFEVAFGLGDDPVANELGAVDPVRIRLGGGVSFLLRGKIDRIDEGDPGQFLVFDYKTGKSSHYSDREYFAGGRQIQHALYALAAEDVLKASGVHRRPRVGRSAYVFPTAKGEGQTFVREQDRRGELCELLNTLFDVVRNGVFVAYPDPKGLWCDYCDYAEACGGKEAVQRSKRKAAVSASVFSPLVEAAGHE